MVGLFCCLMAASLFSAPSGYSLLFSNQSTLSISDSFFRETAFSVSSAVPAKRLQYHEIRKGLFSAELSLLRPDSSRVGFTLLKMDTARFGFRLVGEPGRGKTIREWMKAEKCAAGINGGYFYYKDTSMNRSPLGLTVKKGKKLGGFRSNYSGCFVSDENGPRILYKDKPDSTSPDVLQSFPMLLAEGKIPEAVQVGASQKLNVTVRERRSAVGVDRQGAIYFLVTFQGMSFTELSLLSGLLGFKDCLSMDGGASAQLAAFGRDTVDVSGYDEVPIGIGAFVR